MHTTWKTWQELNLQMEDRQQTATHDTITENLASNNTTSLDELLALMNEYYILKVKKEPQINELWPHIWTRGAHYY